MKVLLLNTSEKTGGAAIAANRLMHSLNKSGVEANMLVLQKQTQNSHVYSLNSNFLKKQINFIRFLWERWVIFTYNGFSKKNLFNVSIANTGNDISKHFLVKEADIIHLHWINQGFLSLKDIEKLTQLGKPIVWTMHDQWAYTGICHYVSNCENFKIHCSCCKKLQRTQEHDLSSFCFNKKASWYNNNVITLVGCSHWIADEAKKSALCKHTRVISIPNPINIEMYTPKDKKKCRLELNLPENKKLILFGACKVSDERKGAHFLKKACDILWQQKKLQVDDISFVIFGGQSEELEQILPFQIYNIGYIDNVETMISLYNAVDLFLIPSLEDNLPNTIMESMSCGTPCVGFHTGGIPEMIDHKVNGYIAKYKNAEDLAYGIYWVLNETSYTTLSKNARIKVETTYQENRVATQYTNLYKSLLEK